MHRISPFLGSASWHCRSLLDRHEKTVLPECSVVLGQMITPIFKAPLFRGDGFADPAAVCGQQSLRSKEETQWGLCKCGGADGSCCMILNMISFFLARSWYISTYLSFCSYLNINFLFSGLLRSLCHTAISLQLSVTVLERKTHKHCEQI